MATHAAIGESLREYLRDFYGRRLKRSADFSQKACYTDGIRKRYGEILSMLPEEVRERHYGCGCPIPADELTGLTPLDPGSGAGADVFILARRVGPRGFVYGVDMTPEQLEVARRWAPEVARRFKYAAPNTGFVEDYIEVAGTVPGESIALAVSDCVINPSPRKHGVPDHPARAERRRGVFHLRNCRRPAPAGAHS